ncbi:hypothetical protein BGZ99_009849, partial [Dissophora globulifera]
MFSKSNKFVAPLVTLLVACMAVEAATVGVVPLPQTCRCSLSYGTSASYPGAGGDVTCDTVGNGNGAVVKEGTAVECNIGTQSAYNSFVVECSGLTITDPAGGVHQGDPLCTHTFPDVPMPTACGCVDPSGVNTTAQTQHVCTGFITNMGTMVNDKCVLQFSTFYQAFGNFCTQVYHGTP